MKPLGPNDPQRVGQYRLLGKLGAGGMGSVYLARSDRGRTVAVKLVQPELANQPEFRQRFWHEVEAARAVGGEWTAPVLECDTQADTPWVATGYVAGPSLHEVVTSTYGALPERTLRILANGLVRALRDIHAAGLVHRDLKPSNVMITIDGPRVIDFGIARALESGGGGLTRTGAAVGSPGFMSPEQCRGEVVTPASDIFCLGSVLTFAATGTTPFGDPNSAMTALMLRIVQDEKDLTNVPERIRELIESCLTQDPAHRPSLDQLLQWTEDPKDTSEEPWLPGALVASLGRHAVGLLDSEDPLRVPPQPTMAPPPAMPASPPPVTPAPGGYPATGAVPTPTAVSAPTPPPSPVPSPAPSPPPSPVPGHPSGVDAMQTMTSAVPPVGYGYPQQAPGTPGYGYPAQAPGTPGYGSTPPPGGPGSPPYQMSPVGPAGPGGPGGQGSRTKFVWLAAVAAVVVFALAIGIAVIATSGGDGDDQAGDPTESSSADATTDGTTDGSSQTAEPAEDAAVPSGYAGAWEGWLTDSSGAQSSYLRVELTEGEAGDTVATTWNVYPELMCEGTGELVSSDSVGITVATNEITGAAPDETQCTALGDQTMELQTNGSLWWSSPDDGYEATLETAVAPGEDGMPYDVMGTWAAETADGWKLEIAMSTTAAAGETAATWTTTAGTACEWQAEMVSGDEVEGDTILMGPAELTSGDATECGYWASYIAVASVDPDTYEYSLDFYRLDEDTPSFTATLASYF